VSLYRMMGMEFSQAQMISLALMLFGAVGFVWAGKSPIMEKQKVD